MPPAKRGGVGRGSLRLPTSSLPGCVLLTPAAAALSELSLRADSHHAEGFACRKRGDYEAAIQAYTRAIELDPRHFKAYFNRGFAYDKVRCGAVRGVCGRGGLGARAIARTHVSGVRWWGRWTGGRVSGHTHWRKPARWWLFALWSSRVSWAHCSGICVTSCLVGGAGGS